MKEPINLFTRPSVLAAVGLLLLNDHVLKIIAPCWFTGKLSDAAGLAFFPLFLAALLSPVAPASLERRRLVIGCAAATVLVFSLVKCVPAMTEWYRVGLGLLQWPLRALSALARGAVVGSPSPVAAVTDPTDLLALPFVIFSIWMSRQEPARTGAESGCFVSTSTGVSNKRMGHRN